VLRELSDDIEIKIQNQLITSAFDTALKYGVKSAPTLVILVNDQAIKVLPGFQSKQSILDTIEQLNLSNASMVS
jgi:predicted DsbA family dithiol-disulfide isomerase